jgi:methylenetetrahydrofolate--tRNA-(uracil-5-)-methyltransferase
VREFEEVRVFEGCMPVETMAKSGKKPAFRPSQAGGAEKTPDRSEDFAVVQLPQE